MLTKVVVIGRFFRVRVVPNVIGYVMWLRGAWMGESSSGRGLREGHVKSARQIKDIEKYTTKKFRQNFEGKYLGN